MFREKSKYPSKRIFTRKWNCEWFKKRVCQYDANFIGAVRIYIRKKCQEIQIIFQLIKPGESAEGRASEKCNETNETS